MNLTDKKELDNFYKAVLSLKNTEECKNFFDDICTIQEMLAISQRFEVARLISEGKSYSEVNKLTGASTATICRVGKCLNYGNGGYKTAINNLNEENENV